MKRDIRRLEQLAEQWLEQAARPEIAARELMNQSAVSMKNVSALIAAGTGKSIMDALRVELGNVDDIEEALLRDRIAEAERTSPVPEGAIVLLRTGWGSRWPEALPYLGDDTPGDASNLHFPGYGEDAARFLVEQRRVGALGIDTASIDYGQSKDFIAHQIAAGGGVPNLENVARVDELPEKGFWVIALPVKIGKGSGGPVRIVAVVP